jgi:hypothetical protein
MNDISDATLDRKSRAIAHYVGWKAAASLLDDPQCADWRNWFLSGGPAEEAPGVLRIDVKDFNFDEGTDQSSRQTVAAARRMARAFVDVCGHETRGKSIAPEAYAERLAAACADTYLMWNGESMEQRDQLNAREDGNIVFAVGNIAEGTLNAVRKSLPFAWPEQPEALFLDWFQKWSDEEDVQTASNRLGYLAEQLEISSRTKKKVARALATSPQSEWLLKSAESAWLEDFMPLYEQAGLSSSQVDQFEDWIPTKKKIRTVVEGDTDESSSSFTTSSSGKRLDDWLTERLNAAPGWDDDSIPAADDLDSGLKEIFEDWSDRPWKMGSPRRFAEERLAACLEHLDARDDRDFANLAPVPELGVKRDTHDAPVPPILDAVWATRRVRGCFPGRLGTDEQAPLQLSDVGFTLYRQAEGEDQPRRPDWDERYHLYSDGHTPLRLREFGLELLDQLEDERRETQSAQFFLCFEFEGDAQPRLPVAFPWRLGDVGWNEKSPVAQAIGEPQDGDKQADAQRFRRVREKLRRIVDTGGPKDGWQLQTEALQGGFGKCFQELQTALDALQSSWETYQEHKRTGFAERAGLHEKLGPGDSYELWPVAKEFIDGYRNAVEKFSRLFGVAGDRAPRLAAGPLDEFMDFGLVSYETEDGDNRVRLLGYHPLRLALFAEMEREAHRELREMLDERSPLREIPVSVIPPTDQTPAVVWPPAGSDDQKYDRAHVAGEGKQFLVPRETEGAGFFSQDFSGYRDTSSREPDLIEPLRPLFRAMAESVFPGMKRRMALELHAQSDTDHGLQPLRLCADLVGRTGRDGVVRGIDLQVSEELDVPATVPGLSEASREGDELDAVARAFTEQRSNDPKFPLEVFSRKSDSEAGGLESHVTMLVRPWQREAEWVVRDGEAGTKTPRSMVWDEAAQSWDAREAPSPDANADGDHDVSELVDFIEQRYQELLIRQWRGEADGLRRILGRSLEASPVRPQGFEMKQAYEQAAEESLRVVVADAIFGAEAVDDIDYDATPLSDDSDDEHSEELRVTYADYHRNEDGPDWRITVLGSRVPDAEKQATEAGLHALYDVDDDRDIETIADQVYEATHRALPAVLREIWTADVGTEMRGELIGHLGVGLFASSHRGTASFDDLPPEWQWLEEGFSPETILLSMDSLQNWTWTRRGGTRGDFLAVTPLGADRVRLVAIESKGSRGTSCYEGVSQARATARKLEERFGSDKNETNREEERRELLRVLAREAFRARRNHREVFNRIAAGGADILEYNAVCVSTARQCDKDQTDLQLDIDQQAEREAAWLRVRGLDGLESLAEK